MTIKEKLYMEYVITKNKLNALRGEKLIGGDNIEEYFNSYDFSNRASHHTKDEIRNMIDYAKRCYESEVKKLRIENYFNTEEGKEEKERLTKEYEALQNERAEMFENTNKKLDIFIKDFLGKEWGVRYGTYSTEIGIVKDDNNGFVNFVFGHSFTIYHDTVFGERFEMNYGTLGSFELLNDDVLRPKYLMGMATFANDKDRLSKLRSYLKSVEEDIKELEKRMDKVSNKLKHPFDE
jgi:hypothetical protein